MCFSTAFCACSIASSGLCDHDRVICTQRSVALDRSAAVLRGGRYSAGATGADALWVGVPVLTMEGQRTVQRFSSSLIHAMRPGLGNVTRQRTGSGGSGSGGDGVGAGARPLSGGDRRGRSGPAQTSTVVFSLKEYEDIAVALANRPNAVRRLRSELLNDNDVGASARALVGGNCSGSCSGSGSGDGALFDHDAWVRRWEAQLRALWEARSHCQRRRYDDDGRAKGSSDGADGPTVRRTVQCRMHVVQQRRARASGGVQQLSDAAAGGGADGEGQGDGRTERSCFDDDDAAIAATGGMYTCKQISGGGQCGNVAQSTTICACACAAGAAANADSASGSLVSSDPDDDDAGLEFDLNGDGKISYGEFMEGMDKDRDGTVTVAEFNQELRGR